MKLCQPSSTIIINDIDNYYPSPYESLGGGVLVV